LSSKVKEKIRRRRSPKNPFLLTNFLTEETLADPMKYIYGPIDSWRLKRSLGVDLISEEGRVCSFNCIYCQISKCQELTSKRRKFVEIKEVREELVEALELVGDKVDYLTLSGIGEPTLASNLPEAVEMLKEVSDKPKAILTNSSLLNLEEVRKPLERLDYVIASLDAVDEDSFQKVNNPVEGIHFDEIIEGLRVFGENYSGTRNRNHVCGGKQASC